MIYNTLHKKTENWTTRAQQKLEINPGAAEWYAIPAPLVALVMLVFLQL